MPTEPQPLGAPSSNGPPDDQPPARPHLPEDVVVEHILTRVPAAAAARLRTVCRSWRDALTSDHFADAHRVARAAANADAPEIVFFAPAPSAAGPARSNNGTAFYRCKLNLLNLTATKSNDESASSAAAHELMTVGNIYADLVLSGTRPCRGLTLLHSQWTPSAYHVCNLSTGEHVSLPPCTPNSNRYWTASAGLGFDTVVREHKVVRLYHDADERPQCEVYGMRTGGWRPCAAQVPPLAAAVVDRRYKHGRPPVFVDGCFYWHVDARAILSLAASTEEFSWVPTPGLRPVRSVRGLAELDGSLCAVVELDPRLGIKHRREPELWTRGAAAAGSCGGSSPPSWSMRCRIVLHSLPRTVRNGLLSRTILPLATSSGGKILLATSFHEVYAYDPESGGAERVFSMKEFLDCTGGEAEVLLNVALHEESVTGVRRRPVGSDGDGAMLKVKLGSGTLARREGHANYYYYGPETLREAIDYAIMCARNSQPMKRTM